MKDLTDIPAILATVTKIEVTDLGCRFYFGEGTYGGETTYHTSILMPLSCLASFELHYKNVVAQFIAEKKAQKEKEECIQKQPKKRRKS